MSEQVPAMATPITPEEQLPAAVRTDQAQVSLETQENPALAYDTAHAEKPDIERAHALGKMVAGVEVTPENTPDESEYFRKKLSTVESQKDYSGELMKARKAAENAANIRASEVRSAYGKDRAAKEAGILGVGTRS
ncbi:MAG TPA: hypothetical protein VFH99_00430 [Candidatus Saccharimonadales bacterium]|nr:hypothetical protein [Candidatus Saccharimonadales bacterium]